MSRMHSIILRPILTEKSTTQTDLFNKVSFKVRQDATKPEIKEAVERLFGVKVSRVNTAKMPGKPKRFGRTMFVRPGYKKAIVTLAEGESLDFFALEELGDDDEFGPEDFADDVE